MTLPSRPRPLLRRILFPGLIACFAASAGCHRSSGQDEDDGGVDARGTDSAAPLDARDQDALVADAAALDGGFDTGFDAGFDAPPCSEPSLVESFHPDPDETRYGRAHALSADGTTLAVSSQDSLSIYDRGEDGWSRVYRRDVMLTGSGRHAPGGVDIDAAGDIVIWGSTVTTESSPDYSAALVFVREASGEWGETRIEQALDTFGGGSAVSVSGDGSTLAVREDRGVEVLLTIYERNEGAAWLPSQTLVAPSFGSPLDSTVELSERGDRVAWHSSEHFRVDVYRKEPSGEWTLEFEVSDFGPVGFAFDAAGERLVLRVVGPDAIVVFDRVGSTWSQSARFPLSAPSLVVPAAIAISPSGGDIYVGASTECGVEVLRWSERGMDWVQETSQQTGVPLDTVGPPYVQHSMSVAGDGTVALAIPDARFNGERTPPEAVGVYLVR